MWIKVVILLFVILLFCGVSYIIGYESGREDMNYILEDIHNSEIDKIKKEAKEEHYLTD